MKIKISNDVPDGTYFTSSDVEPVVNDKQITVFNGRGSRRSWGYPETTSSVVVNTDTFTAVHVGFHHKHRGGQQWYYYVKGERVTWAQLSDVRRKQVIASLAKAPGWAHHPGKLRSEVKKPETKTAYKIVRLDGEKLVSLYDAHTEYKIGKRLTEKAQPDHNGGYYAYPTIEGVKGLWQSGLLVPERCYEGVTKIALIEVEIAGTIIEYNSKVAATYLKPIRILEVIDVH